MAFLISNQRDYYAREFLLVKKASIVLSALSVEDDIYSQRQLDAILTGNLLGEWSLPPDCGLRYEYISKMCPKDVFHMPILLDAVLGSAHEVELMRSPHCPGQTTVGTRRFPLCTCYTSVEHLFPCRKLTLVLRCEHTTVCDCIVPRHLLHSLVFEPPGATHAGLCRRSNFSDVAGVAAFWPWIPLAIAPELCLQPQITHQLAHIIQRNSPTLFASKTMADSRVPRPDQTMEHLQTTAALANRPSLMHVRDYKDEPKAIVLLLISANTKPADLMLACMSATKHMVFICLPKNETSSKLPTMAPRAEILKRTLLSIFGWKCDFARAAQKRTGLPIKAPTKRARPTSAVVVGADDVLPT